MDSIRGVYISGISPGGAAEKHGLRTDDVILSVNGEEVNESNQLQQKIAVLNPGDIVELTIFREGKEIKKQVVLGMLERQEEELAERQPDRRGTIEPEEEQEEMDRGEGSQEVDFETFEFGFRVMAVEHDEQNNFRLLVIDVVNGSEADGIGLQEGDRILKVNGHKVEDLQSLKHFIAQNSGTDELISFEVETQNGDIKNMQSK
jgi:serine protease Do